MVYQKSTYSILCIPLALLLLLETGTLWQFIKETVAGYDTWLVNYMWMALGIVVFMAIRYLILKLHWPFRRGRGKANLELTETFMHEFTHQFVALLLGRRLHSFHAEQYSGSVTTSGNEHTRLFVTLAPYCLPLLTLLLVAERVMIKPEWLWLHDMFIGLTVGFHGVCFYKDTRSDQPDIKQFPLYFAYLYIVTFLLLNITITLVSIGRNLNIVDTIIYILKHFWSIIASVSG